VEGGGDLVGVRVPALLGIGELRLVARLRGCDQVGGDQDVRPQLPRQRTPGGGAVEGLDGIADVGLVAEQPSDGCVGVRGARLETDDREPCPGDVVLTELSP
jgi:hypothetical protein